MKASDLGLDSDSREWLEICFVRFILKTWSREKIVSYLDRQSNARKEHLRSLLNAWRKAK